MSDMQKEVATVLRSLQADVLRGRVVVEEFLTHNGIKVSPEDSGKIVKELDGTFEITLKCKEVQIDRSDKADAQRFRWLLNGNGYFMEEEGLCGHICTSSPKMQDAARRIIDEEMEPDREGGGK